MNFNTLVAPGFAGDDADIGFCNPEGFGDKGNQMFVGFAIHRRSSDAQFYTIAQCFCEAVTGGAWLHPDIEHKIIILPLKKHGCSPVNAVVGNISFTAKTQRTQRL